MLGEVGHLHEVLLEQTIAYSSGSFFFLHFLHSRIFFSLNITLMVVFLHSLKINKKKKNVGKTYPAYFESTSFEGFHLDHHPLKERQR